MKEKAIILDSKAMQRAIARIAFEIIEHNKGTEDVCIVGIITRGVEIAQRIADKIFEVEGKRIAVGKLDITCYRDDRISDEHEDRTDIPFDVKDKKVVLVDDVIYTGRSVRAAIDAIMKRGRPLLLELAVLVDRGHRELPIRADFVGKNLPTSADEKVKVYVEQLDGLEKVVILKKD